MQTMRKNARGLSVILALNMDRVMSLGAILTALSFSAWIASAL